MVRGLLPPTDDDEATAAIDGDKPRMAGDGFGGIFFMLCEVDN